MSVYSWPLFDIFQENLEKDHEDLSLYPLPAKDFFKRLWCEILSSANPQTTSVDFPLSACLLTLFKKKKLIIDL